MQAVMPEDLEQVQPMTAATPLRVEKCSGHGNDSLIVPNPCEGLSYRDEPVEVTADQGEIGCTAVLV